MGSTANLEVNLCSRTTLVATAVTDLLALGTGTLPSVVAPVQWLPTLFLLISGLFLILSGLFKPQLDRRLGLGERSHLFTHPGFQKSARKTAFLSRVVLVMLGISFMLQAVGNGYFAYTILNLFTVLFLALAVIGLFLIIGTTIYFSWIK